MDMKDFDAYAIGIVCAAVCVSNALDDDEAVRRMNDEHPTGIASGWGIADADMSFGDGQANGCPCNDAPDTHRHILMCC